ncbi:MAG: hypothetical protein ABL901_05895 [Hyphomicrobiaceae bacterium]
MSAEIVDLALFRAKRAVTIIVGAASAGSASVTALTTGSSLCPAATPAEKPPFLFWTGASGTRYVHTVYNLFECPPVEGANYILVKRHSDGHRTVVSIGRATSEAGTLNLAEIRLRSAQLGANEVHIHLLADSPAQSQLIESDLRGSLALA